jgi:chromosome segregation ATPase
LHRQLRQSKATIDDLKAVAKQKSSHSQDKDQQVRHKYEFLLDSKNKQLSEVSTALSRAEATIARVEAEAAASHRRMEVKVENVAAEAEAAKAKAEMDKKAVAAKHRAEIEVIKGECEEKLSVLKRDIISLTADLASAQSGASSTSRLHANTLQHLQDQLASAVSEQMRLKAQCDSVREDMAAAMERARVSARVETETVKTQLQDKIDGLTSQCRREREGRLSAESDVTAAHDKAASLEAEVVKMKKHVIEAEAELLAVQGKLAAVMEQGKYQHGVKEE